MRVNEVVAHLMRPRLPAIARFKSDSSEGYVRTETHKFNQCRSFYTTELQIRLAVKMYHYRRFKSLKFFRRQGFTVYRCYA